MSMDVVEGRDYLVDYYAVIGVEPDAEAAEIRQKLNDSLMGYHPDRLQGLAPEFQEKGERMARLLNKARGILTDPEQRQAYDEVLSTWDGPVSTDGTPIVSIERMMARQYDGLEPAEVTAALDAHDAVIEQHLQYDPHEVEELEATIVELGERVPSSIRRQYENALLRRDRVLGIQQADRAQALGADTTGNGSYRVSLDHASEVAGELEAAHEAARQPAAELGNPRARAMLELIAGDGALPPKQDAVEVRSRVDAMFEAQRGHIVELARQREAILEKRLDNLRLTYPYPELQADVDRRMFFIGLVDESSTKWMLFYHDKAKNAVNNVDLSEDYLAQLDAGEFAVLLESGIGVATVPILEQVDIRTLIETAVNKYIDRED